ncbi:TPA: response regulator transcription factor [Streptococcus pyogenes]
MNILLVNDDEMILQGIVAFLSEYDYTVITAKDGEQAIEYFKRHIIHLIILDVMIPKKNGFEVLLEIKRERDIPIIVLSAKEDEETQAKAFELGADDYVTKPFSLLLLVSRIKTILKRYCVVDELWQYQNMTVDFSTHCAYYKGQEVKIRPKELAVLQCLVKYKNQVLSREQILEQVARDVADLPYDRVVDVYIRKLRKNLNLDCIKTVKNVGYKISL